MTNPSLVNHVRRAAMAGLAATLAILAWASPSVAADQGTSGVVSTGGGRLNVRAKPSLSSGKIVATQKNKARVVLLCQVKGDKVKGTQRTTKMWNKIKGGGYISDAYTKRSKVPPTCAAEKPAPKPVGGAASSLQWRHPVTAKIWGGFHTKDRPTHDGVDLGAPRGTRIRAAADGVVIVAMCNASTNNCDKDGSPKVMGCGWYVDILHAGGIVTRYCHMVSKPYVKVGQKVSRAEVLGRVGSSGNSSGPHLHFEVHVPPKEGARAKPVNPVKFYAEKGIKLDRG